MPHDGGYRRVYADESVATCWSYVLLLVGVVVGALAIGFGAVQGLDTTSGFEEESDFAFTASLWLFIFGIVLLVALFAFCIDAWRRNGNYYVTPPGWLSYFWLLLFVFLCLPWNVFGHVFLLRAWASTGVWSSTAVYIMMIVAVVVAWLIVLGTIRYVAFVLFLHNWQIGVSRRYLTAVSDASAGNYPLPILEERYRVLPYVMGVMDAEPKTV